MRYLSLIGIFLIAIFGTSISFATTINVNEISTFTVGGNDMEGMGVTINFDNGSSQVTTWKDDGGDDGSASGSVSVGGTDYAWSLKYNGSDTFVGEWILTSGLPVNSFTVDGSIADIFFDFYNDKSYTGNSSSTYEGTLNSSHGVFGYYGTQNQTLEYYDIVLPLSSSDSMTGYETDNVIGRWDYIFSNPVALYQPIVGDLYGTFQVDFENPITEFTFYLDTDRSAIPEPATMLLLGIGLFGLAGYGSRLRKAKKS